jgi:zinc/manganese transport system ATP-binding protein
VLLGLQPLTAGRVTVAGRAPKRGDREIGYIPQQRGFDRDLPLRGRDFVRMGLDGHRWGVRLPSRTERRAVEQALAAVDAAAFADKLLGTLSGGEQQRLRIAQALLGQPKLLLCDEPLLSLDLRQQQAIAALIDHRRRQLHIPVLLITHEINPVLPYVDRVLYLVGGRWAIGTPAQVMTSQRLSVLYQAPVDVLRVRDRIVVVGASEAAEAHHPSAPVTHAGPPPWA